MPGNQDKELRWELVQRHVQGVDASSHLYVDSRLSTGTVEATQEMGREIQLKKVTGIISPALVRLMMHESWPKKYY